MAETRRMNVRMQRINLNTPQGSGPAVGFKITGPEHKASHFGGLFIARKGINVLPEFAKGFGFDASDVVEGLPPEQYQIRIQIPLVEPDGLHYTSEDEHVFLKSGDEFLCVLPMIFQGANYFLNAPPEDVFLVTKDAAGKDVVLDEVEGVHAMLMSVAAAFPNSRANFTAQLTIIVPHKSPPQLDHMVGKTNPNPIDPMPNS